jgi:secondary thiamine-phosphate synthase enzyme
MEMHELQVDASRRTVVDITDDATSYVEQRGDGLLSVFVPHATAGVAVMETGSGSERDLVEALNRLLPRDDRYTHRHGSRGHGADHVLPAFVSPSITLPVRGGRIALGTWQRIVLVDLNVDNPRRRVLLSFLAG